MLCEVQQISEIFLLCLVVRRISFATDLWFEIFNYGKPELSGQRDWTKWGARRHCKITGTMCCFIWVSEFL